MPTCRRNRIGEDFFNLIDGDLNNLGNLDQSVNPWYVFKLVTPISDMQAVKLYPRTDGFWSELANVTVALSNRGLVNDTSARVCGTQISAKDSDRGKGILVPCVGGGVWEYVIVQRSSSTPVNFGMAEISVMRGGERATLGCGCEPTVTHALTSEPSAKSHTLKSGEGSGRCSWHTCRSLGPIKCACVQWWLWSERGGLQAVQQLQHHACCSEPLLAQICCLPLGPFGSAACWVPFILKAPPPPSCMHLSWAFQGSC